MKLIWRILYFFYRSGSGLRYWITRRFTGAGLMVLAALMAASLMGPDTENNVSYQSFTFLLCLLLMAMCLSVFYRGRFSAQRLAPRYGTVGSPMHYHIQIKEPDRSHSKWIDAARRFGGSKASLLPRGTPPKWLKTAE